MEFLDINEPAAIAARFINRTSRPVFLTGKAGTGKTTFLKNIIKHTYKKTAIAAPTGIAAINAGGVTMHSLFQLPFGAFVPTYLDRQQIPDHIKINDPKSLFSSLKLNAYKRALLQELELIIIDEVSMVRADLLDAVDLILKQVRRNQLPFGGIQILFIGDLLQLPPVVKEEEWQILKQYYNSPFFFDAKVILEHPPVYIELEKIFRQQDNSFIQILNNLRHNIITESDVQTLNQYYKPEFQAGPEDSFITLTTHNHKADKINREKLNELEGKSFFYEAIISDDFPENAFPVELKLELKKGAQIMFIKNDSSGNQRYFNGKLGVIDDLKEDKIMVRFPNESKPILVERYQWENVRFVVNETTKEVEEEVIGKFQHYPIRLAWAITIHKSQGLTFDKAIIDIGDTFAPGQAYVALSRLRSLSGLVLSHRINRNIPKFDESLEEFTSQKLSKETINQILSQEEMLFGRQFLKDCYQLERFKDALQEVLSDTKEAKSKSVKTRFRSKFEELVKAIHDLIPTTEKFQAQIAQLVNMQDDSKLEKLEERILAANSYFEPRIREVYQTILNTLKEISRAKKIKGFRQELIKLESDCYDIFRQLNKAEVFVSSLRQKKEFDKEEWIRKNKEANRIEQLRAVQNHDFEDEMDDVDFEANKIESGKKTNTKNKTNKQEKVPTHEISIKMFKDGLSAEEIAKERKLSHSTIIKHLSQGIAMGIIDAERLIDRDRSNQIIAAAKELNTLKLSEIRAKLGEDFSFDEIKLALAGHLAEGD